MSTKLRAAIDAILDDAQNGHVKEASAPAPEFPPTAAGVGLRKLAKILRETPDDPSYEDLSSFLGGLI